MVNIQCVTCCYGKRDKHLVWHDSDMFRVWCVTCCGKQGRHVVLHRIIGSIACSTTLKYLKCSVSHVVILEYSVSHVITASKIGIWYCMAGLGASPAAGQSAGASSAQADEEGSVETNGGSHGCRSGY